ncbi:MAG: T9SS type A sorting domain-containing protein [Chitinophagales bacterium]
MFFKFSIVPNPSNGLFDLKISALKSAKYNIVLYSITGQEINRDVVSIHAGNNTKSFYLNIEKGMYYMTIENEDGSTSLNG